MKKANDKQVDSSDLDLDLEFELHTIKSFKKETSGYSLTFEDGWSFWMQTNDFAPKVGQTAKLYGRGTGYQVRGLTVNDRVVFYRTAMQQETLNRKEQEKSDFKKRKDYDSKVKDYERRVNALPLP